MGKWCGKKNVEHVESGEYLFQYITPDIARRFSSFKGIDILDAEVFYFMGI